MRAAAELQWQTQWTTSLVLAGATFAAGMALRHRKVPAILAWLGLISYSVYLLHPLILNAYRNIRPLHHHHPLAIQLLLAAGVLGVVLACSAMTYRFVEAPMQELGRRVAKMLQARLGPDEIKLPTPVPAKRDAQAMLERRRDQRREEGVAGDNSTRRA
jgi:peptidoglycan/LPS O-acetylase OafA/YrhL